ncbi:MAG: NAD(P)H-dependent oxidoreductase, partial [Candidatus Paceibacterota bacterium]
LYIPVILGTARDGRKSEHVVPFVLDALENTDGVETELIDIRDFPIDKTKPSWEDHEETKEWKEKADKADAFFIITPEYNHGYPGELKLFLDSAYKEYFYKPVALAGVSSGRISGGRVLEHLKPILIEMGMVVLKDHLYFGNIGDIIDENGELIDSEGKLTKQLDVIIERLVVFAHGLAPVREKLLN